MIPFSRPYVSPRAKLYIESALANIDGNQVQSFRKRSIDLLAGIYGHRRILLTTSGSHALELASLCVDIGPGDTVTLPSFNFSSDANAVANFGGHLHFVDIDPSTGSATAGNLFGSRPTGTKMVSYVNYSGINAEAEEISRRAKDAGLVTVEDNSHGLGGSQSGRALGTFGDFSVLSFHSTKNFPIGEGGALIVNTAKYWEKAQIAYEKGTNRQEFADGKIDKYTWQGAGSSYVLNEISSAFLAAQLEDFSIIQKGRGKNAAIYEEEFKPERFDSQGVSLMKIHDGAKPSNHFFFLRTRTKRARDLILSRFRKAGLPATSHYEPLHSSPYAQRLGTTVLHDNLPSTTQFAETVVRLPLYPDLSDTEARLVTSALNTLISSKEFSLLNLD